MMMTLNLKINDDTYVIRGKASKVVDFISHFYDDEFSIHKKEKEYIYINDEDAKKLSQDQIKRIKTFCEDNKINDFQTYETMSPIKVSMDSNEIRHMTSVQKDFQSLIHGLINQAKAKA